MSSSLTFQISVVVCLYNSCFEDIKKTLLSILFQKGIKLQVVLADDGSKNDYFNEIKRLFKEYNFVDYKFSKNEINQGTCINYYNAVLEADGEYIKPISPKDYLYSATTLSDWYKYVKENNIGISFGKSIYYVENEGKMQPIVLKSTQPTLREFYRLNSYKLRGVQISNLILYDCILGASYLCDKALLLSYLPEIIGKLRVCEDFAYRLMLLDGNKIFFYEEPVVYYSYGTGVSKKKNNDGTNFLHSDEVAFDQLLKDRDSKNYIAAKIKQFVKKKGLNSHKNRLLSFLYFPSALIIRLMKSFYIIRGVSRTENIVDVEFLNSIGINI